MDLFYPSMGVPWILSNCKQDNALGLWSWGSAERFFLDIANKHFPQRMMQPPPPPPAFLCHSFTPSNEVVNGSFDAGSFSTKSRIDSHASLLVLASLHCCVGRHFCVEVEEREMIEKARFECDGKKSTSTHSKETYLQLFGKSLCFVFELSEFGHDGVLPLVD